MKAIQRIPNLCNEVRRDDGLPVRKRQRRTRRLGISIAQRQRAEDPNPVWSWDFVHEQTAHDSRFHIFTLLPEQTRQPLAVYAGGAIRAQDVIICVEGVIERYGSLSHIRRDNGHAFIAYAIED